MLKPGYYMDLECDLVIVFNCVYNSHGFTIYTVSSNGYDMEYLWSKEYINNLEYIGAL